MTERIDKQLNMPRASEPQASVRNYTAAAGGFGALSAVFTEAWRHTGFLRAVNVLAKLNQAEGFDCSSCAWPDPPSAERTAFEFCENGAKATLWDNTKRQVTPEFLQQTTVTQLRTETDFELESHGRLVDPLRYDAPSDTYRPIPWSLAFREIADQLKSLARPDDAVFYTSGRTSNEAAYLYQLLARKLGTNNLPDCSNMCHESSGTGLGRTIGIGKGTVSLADFDAAEAVFVIGQNPGTNHPRMLSALEKAAKRGAKIVSINPLLERGLQRFSHPQNPLALLGQSQKISSHYVQVRINGDMALMQGMGKHLLAMHSHSPCLDTQFIADHTEGFEQYQAHLHEISWEDIEVASGVQREEIESIATIYAHSKASIICWAMGLTQHKNGVGNITEVVNLLLLLGNLGKPGAGACPVRGHSNVQGDRTMGIYEKPAAHFLDRLESRYSFTPPRKHGLDTVGAIQALREGKVAFFMSMGGNFVAATPDTAVVADGMQRCEMTVSVSTKLNRTHVYPGKRAYILPCLVRSELDIRGGGLQFVSCENSMSIVSKSSGHLPPTRDSLKSEVSIVCSIAKAVFGDQQETPWHRWQEDYDLVRNEIEAVIPGFEKYNDRIRQRDGFLLPNGVRARQWHTQSGRAIFSNNTFPSWTLEAGQLLLGTVRSHDQFNTTIYGQDDRYRGIFGGRRILMISAEDLQAQGLMDGETVNISSHYEGKVRTVNGFRLVKTDLPLKSVMSYFPETNPLIPAESFATYSRTPTSKSVVVTIERAMGSD